MENRVGLGLRVGVRSREKVIGNIINWLAKRKNQMKDYKTR